MKQRARLTISGRVQGVGFRAWGLTTATNLGLQGWIRNLENGSVEILCEGEQGAVEKMIAACGQGPQFAKVTDVEVESLEFIGDLKEFRIAR